MSFDWEIGIDYQGVTYGTCANVDIDIFIADAEGFDINDPWATFNDVMYAATGDCPEVMAFTPDNIPDGSYILFSELWANEFGGLGTNTPMPIRASFVRAGVFEVVYEQDASQAFNSDTPGVDDPNYDGEVIDTYIADSCTHSGVEIFFLKSQRNVIAKDIIRITKCNNMRFIGKSLCVAVTLG